VYKYEGSLNKFLMDDKGSTLIAVFGLPPLAHENDAVRGVLSALTIVEALRPLGCLPKVGITTGNAFCGVVGSRGRREYSVLGDTVNLSARLMQHACGPTTGYSIICDKATTAAVRVDMPAIPFKSLGQTMVKGKAKPIDIFTPPITGTLITASPMFLSKAPPRLLSADLQHTLDVAKKALAQVVNLYRNGRAAISISSLSSSSLSLSLSSSSSAASFSAPSSSPAKGYRDVLTLEAP
jgi:hypothetical protein